MALVDVSIHLQSGKAPKVTVQKFSDFCTVRIGTNPKTTHFLYSSQQVTNFKNNLLWAFEKPIKITE